MNYELVAAFALISATLTALSSIYEVLSKKPLRDFIPTPDFIVRQLPSKGNIKALNDVPIHNPIYLWGNYPLRMNDWSVTVPALQLQWGRVKEETEGQRFIKAVTDQFIELYKDELPDWYVFAISTHADHFLKDLLEKKVFQDLGPTLYDSATPYDSEKPKSKPVLFDVTFNRGSTLRYWLRNAVETNFSPTKFVVLVFNDIIPPGSQYRLWEQKGIQLEIMYRLSDLYELWEPNKELVTAIRIVQAAVYGGGIDLEDDRVKRAIRLIREHALHAR